MNTQLSFLAPRARVDDPDTSHVAARDVAPGNEELVRRIREVMRREYPLTAFEIAERVCESQPGRWSEGTVRTACARAGLSVWPHAHGLSPRGRACQLLFLEVLPVPGL